MIAEAREGETYGIEVYKSGWSDGVDAVITNDEVEKMVNDCLKEGYDLITISMSGEERLTGVVGRWTPHAE